MAAWVQADLEALDKAYKSGHSRVEYDGRVVQFRSIEEYQKLRAMMLNEINAATTGTGQRIFSTLRYGKGLG